MLIAKHRDSFFYPTGPALRLKKLNKPFTWTGEKMKNRVISCWFYRMNEHINILSFSEERESRQEFDV